MSRLFRRDELCPSNFSEDSRAEPISGWMSLHRIVAYTSVSCTAVTLVLSIYMILGQMLHYRHPRVQRQVIRLLLLAPILGGLTTIGVADYRTTHYIEIFADAYEVFAIVAMFLLFLAYLSPSSHFMTQVAVFSDNQYGGYRFFRLRYMLVMQAIPGRILTSLAALAITARGCATGNAFQRGHTIIRVVDTIQLLLAISGVLPFMLKNRKHLEKADPAIMRRIISIKCIIVFQVISSLIMRILVQTHTFVPSRTVSFNDIDLGIPGLITVILAFFAAVISIPNFTPRAYEGYRFRGYSDSSLSNTAYKVANTEEPMDDHHDSPEPEQPPKLSMFRAILEVINITDILFVAPWQAFQLFMHPSGYQQSTDRELLSNQH